MKKDLYLSELEAQTALELPNRDLFFMEQFGLINAFAAINAAANLCLAQANVVIAGANVGQSNACAAQSFQYFGDWND